MGDFYSSVGQSLNAYQAYTGAILLDPTSPQIYYKRGELYIKVSKLISSQPLIRMVISIKDSILIDAQRPTSPAATRRYKLFPVMLDKSVMKIKVGWPSFIRNTRHIRDFTRWKRHGSYKKGFESLLRELNAEAGTLDADITPLQ